MSCQVEAADLDEPPFQDVGMPAQMRAPDPAGLVSCRSQERGLSRRDARQATASLVPESSVCRQTQFVEECLVALFGGIDKAVEGNYFNVRPKALLVSEVAHPIIGSL